MFSPLIRLVLCCSEEEPGGTVPSCHVMSRVHTVTWFITVSVNLDHLAW